MKDYLTERGWRHIKGKEGTTGDQLSNIKETGTSVSFLNNHFQIELDKTGREQEIRQYV